jgi:hypothetical protein
MMILIGLIVQTFEIYMGRGWVCPLVPPPRTAKMISHSEGLYIPDQAEIKTNMFVMILFKDLAERSCGRLRYICLLKKSLTKKSSLWQDLSSLAHHDQDKYIYPHSDRPAEKTDIYAPPP